MVIDLIGIYQDASVAKVLGAPTDARRTLRITKTDAIDLRLTVLDSSGSPMPLAMSIFTVFTWTCKKHPDDAVAAWSVAGEVSPSDGENRVNFTLSPNATRLLDVGQYFYDVWASSANGKFRAALVPISALFLEPAVLAL